MVLKNYKLILIILFSSKNIYNFWIFHSYFPEKKLANNEGDIKSRHISKVCFWRWEWKRYDENMLTCKRVTFVTKSKSNGLHCSNSQSASFDMNGIKKLYPLMGYTFFFLMKHFSDLWIYFGFAPRGDENILCKFELVW